MLRALKILAPLFTVACGCSDVGCLGFGVIDLDGDLVVGEAVEFLVQVGADVGACSGIVGEPLTCEGRLEALFDGNLPTELWFMNPTRQRLASVLVTRDDAIVFDETFPVDLEGSRPNGLMCGPTCRSFRAVVAW